MSYLTIRRVVDLLPFDKLHKNGVTLQEMKKLVTFVIAILYLGVSSGIAMEIHYCMGKKSGVGFYEEAGKKCGKCGMKEKKGCCNDEHKFYKLSDSHKNVSGLFVFTSPAIIQAPVAVAPGCKWFDDSRADNALKNHCPPLYARPSACILNCLFRI